MSDQTEPSRAPFVKLGVSNGWGKPPDIVVKCEAEKHQTRAEVAGRCLTRVICPICRYTYEYDSSD